MMLRGSKDLLIQLLRWSEKYFRTDMVYLFHGGFWVTAAQAISSLSALALAVTFANLVPPETYGTYKYVLSLAGIFAIFSLPGMNTALMQTAARGEESTIHAVTRARILYSFLGSVCALIGSAYYLYNGNVELSLALLTIAVTLPLLDTFTSYIPFLAGKRQFDVRAQYHAITYAVSTLTLIATIFFTDDLTLILVAYFVPLIAVRAVLYYRVARTIPHTAHPAEGREVTRYGKHLTAMQILGVIATECDKILIWKFLGPAQVAVYTFALAFPEQIKVPLKGIGELAFPKFATQTPEQIRANLPALWRKLAVYAVGLSGVSLLYILAAPYIFKLIFPQYMESVLYSQIYALTVVTNIASIPIAVLGAQKKTKTQYIISTIQPAITIGFLVLLVPVYGIMGAIIALLLGKFTTTAIWLGSLFTIR